MIASLLMCATVAFTNYIFITNSSSLVSSSTGGPLFRTGKDDGVDDSRMLNVRIIIIIESCRSYQL